MNIESWFAFSIASMTLLLIPGPTILSVISYSISHGRRANLPLIAAVALGDATALFASLMGLGVLLSTSAFWFTVAKGLGGLYLLYLGIKLLIAGVSPVDANSSVKLESRWNLFLNTYLVTALNPKGIIFFLAFLPQFVSPQGDTITQLWILAVTFVLLATINATGYAIFAVKARKLLFSNRAMRGFNIFGGLLMSIAGISALLLKRTG